MNLTARLRVVTIAALIATGAATLAQMRHGRLYNPSSEITVKGTVDKASTIAGQRAWNGIHLSVLSDRQTWDVHVGPATYVLRNGFTFSAGDRIEIVGSKVEINGATALIAREITREGKVLTLRDKQGFPKWSRGQWTSQ